MSDTLQLVVNVRHIQLPKSAKSADRFFPLTVPPVIFPILHYSAEKSLVLTELRLGNVDDKLKRIGHLLSVSIVADSRPVESRER